MDFERSACGAAVAGDLNRLQALLRKASKATAREKTASGLTPLVCGVEEKRKEKGNQILTPLTLFSPFLLSLSLPPFSTTPHVRAMKPCAAYS